MSTELSSEYGVNACSEVSSEHFEIFDGKSKVEVDGVSKSGSVSRDVMQIQCIQRNTNVTNYNEAIRRSVRTSKLLCKLS